MSGLQVLYLNISLYGTAFIFFKMKYGFLNLSTIAILFYLFGSIASLLFFITPIYQLTFSNDGKLNVEGLLWSFLFNFLFCLLLRYFKFSKSSIITSYNQNLVDNIQKIIIVAYVIILIFDLPVSLANINSGDLADLRDLTYTEGANDSKLFIVNILKRIFGEMDLILLSIAVFNLLVLKRAKKIDILSIVVYFLMILNTMAAYISRSAIVFRLIGVAVILFALNDFVKKKVIRNSFFIGVPILIFLSFFFNSITNSRFSENATNNLAQQYANLRYAGEPQINFITLMYNKTNGSAYGYRSFPLYRKVVGLEYFGQAGTNKTDNLTFLDKIHHQPNYILYSAAGDWYLDLGPFWPIVLLIVFNYILFLNYNKKETFNFVHFIFAIVLTYYVCNGAFYAQYQNEAGNLLLLLLIILYYKSKKRSYRLRSNFSFKDRSSNLWT